MYISYDYYRTFYYVAKFCSFTKAANALMNNQPNVTRAIKNLEGELGCKLFVRSNRSVALTPEGERLYEHISVAFSHIEAAEKELLLDNSLQSGSISIGASEVALHCFLLPVLKEFREMYPEVRIQVSNHSTPEAIAALKEGLVDFAVVTTPADVPKYTKKTVLKEIQEAAVCGPAYSFLTKEQISAKILAKYPLVSLGAHTKTYTFYADWFTQHGMTFMPDIEAATADQILPLVRNDLGIGFVPEEFLKNESEETGIFRLNLKETIPARSVCMVTSTERLLSIAAGQLEKIILRNAAC